MSSAYGEAYVNPLGVNIADPVVIHDGGSYYLYGTTSDSEGFIVYTSKDLVHWHDKGFAFRKTPQSWGRGRFWAPCIIKRANAFYLFYSAIGNAGGHASHRICLAASSSPLGPFQDIKTPLLNTLTAAIDPHVFIDDDGEPYIYYSIDVCENKVSRIYVSHLSQDLTTVIRPATLCIEPSAVWEGAIWNEAPYVIKVGKKYVLMYSARGYFEPSYAVGYAVSDSPMGPWVKAEQNPILKRTDVVSGPGHNCIVDSPDGREKFIMYHVHKHPNGGWERELAMDRIDIKEEAGTIKLVVHGPTNTPQPMPSCAR